METRFEKSLGSSGDDYEAATLALSERLPDEIGPADLAIAAATNSATIERRPAGSLANRSDDLSRASGWTRGHAATYDGVAGCSRGPRGSKPSPNRRCRPRHPSGAACAGQATRASVSPGPALVGRDHTRERRALLRHQPFPGRREAAFQETFHPHLLVFPHHRDDAFQLVADWSVAPPRTELDAVAARIRRAYRPLVDPDDLPARRTKGEA